ncbi:MAG: DUF2017 domain-containing protein [Microbacteriaceae bacterium]
MRAFTRRRHGYLTRLDAAEATLLRSLAGQLGGLLEPLTAPGAAGSGPGGMGGLSEPGGLSGPGGIDGLDGLVFGGSEAPPEDSALARLLPDAYRDDVEASREWRRMTERGLASRKAANARVVLATAVSGDVLLGEEEAQAWLRTLTDLRLVVADRLGILDEDGPPDGDGPSTADEQSRALAEVYDWLGFAQESLVRAVDR